MRLNASCIMLVGFTWAMAIRPVMSQDSAKGNTQAANAIGAGPEAMQQMSAPLTESAKRQLRRIAGRLGPFLATEVQFMRDAEAVYVFSVKAESTKAAESKDLRPLGRQARQALLSTLCTRSNLNTWGAGGLPCEEGRDIGVLFQNSKDKLILHFCSCYDPFTGYEFEGTFGHEFIGGWLKEGPWDAWKERFARSEMRK